MSNDVINVGLIGLGTIGKGVAKILLQNAANLAKRSGRKISLKAAADLDIESDRGIDFSGVTLTTDAMSIIEDNEIDIVVEVIGGIGAARKFITEALKRGKHVVTSNKEVIAKHGSEFLELSKEHNCNLYYEAAVGGGIPIIHGLKNCLSANNLTKVVGIMNGTTNFILTKMYQEGADFETVLKEAQALGFAEADPTSDVDGYDVAYKLSILASIAFNTQFKYEDIYFEGIRHISAGDIEVAKSMGYVIKLVAIGVEHDNGIELRVHPIMLNEWHPLSGVNGSFNAVFVEGNYIDEAMFYGPGAGELPTASAVVGDIMDIAQQPGERASHPSQFTNFREVKVLPIGEIESEYYLRIKVKDETGVMAAITRVCADSNVSIKSLHQNEPDKENQTDIVIITHTTREADMQRAIEGIKNAPGVIEAGSLIRVGL